MYIVCFPGDTSRMDIIEQENLQFAHHIAPYNFSTRNTDRTLFHHKLNVPLLHLKQNLNKMTCGEIILTLNTVLQYPNYVHECKKYEYLDKCHLADLTLMIETMTRIVRFIFINCYKEIIDIHDSNDMFLIIIRMTNIEFLRQRVYAYFIHKHDNLPTFL